MAGFKIRQPNYKFEQWNAITMLLTPTHAQKLRVIISLAFNTLSHFTARLYRHFPHGIQECLLNSNAAPNINVPNLNEMLNSKITTNLNIPL